MISDEGHKKVLDVCCGPKGMWFDKHDPRALFLDKRMQTYVDTYPCGTKTNVIDPDIIGDFTDIKQSDNSFWLVVFDPPHIEQSTESQITKKYGSLRGDWREEIRKGFSECFRVLKPNGTLIFKWNESEIKSSDVLKLIPYKPLFGHTTGRQSKTIWMAFMKQSA